MPVSISSAPSQSRRKRPAIVPYTRMVVAGMLTVCDCSSEYVWCGTRQMTQVRPTRLRDQAVIRLLVDTGARASELCGLGLSALDLANRRVHVVPESAKGAKGRYLRIAQANVESAHRRASPVDRWRL